MRVLVCGGRDYRDAVTISTVMDALLAEHKHFAVVHGGAIGADRLAEVWAQDHGLPVFACAANWQHYKRAAGPIRNGWMVEYFRPDLVVAFPGGRGTAHMVELAKRSGIPVKVVEGQ